ncbi:MAG: histidinol phosphatase [Cyanothece sp. SIO1E1]|nr:histidinol phosphatase [Cyanothece sp. SIO1E1]
MILLAIALLWCSFNSHPCTSELAHLTAILPGPAVAINWIDARRHLIDSLHPDHQVMPPLLLAERHRHKPDLIEGAIDFHVHSAPDVTERSLDDFELAQMAADAGMQAVVLKNHVASTAARAVLVNKIVPGVQLFGGVVLNRSVGGINPAAVEAMYRLGHNQGKVVWLPTIDADYHHQVFHQPGPGIKVAQAGKLLPEVERVLQLVAQHNLVLGTGHISPAEVKLVVERAHSLGIKNILITHAMADVPGLSIADMQTVTALGAYLELVYVNDLMGPESTSIAHQNWHRVSVDQMAAAIKTIGAEHFVLSTDLGRRLDPLPAEGYQRFVQGLMQAGITEADIDLMMMKNPARLLGISEFVD